MKHKVNVDAVDEQYGPLVKPEMTTDEIGQLGMAIAHYKIECFKNWWAQCVRKIKRLFKKDSRM
jgi:hypothetical protein